MFRANAPQRIGVIGGGTAGYLTAIALKRWKPSLDVTLVESSAIPIIGVGEATTPPLLPFLHRFLGIDPHELHRVVRPTWKLGIKFEWANPGPFNYPFMPEDVAEAYAYDGHIDTGSLESMLMTSKRAPMTWDGAKVQSVLPKLRLAYHLDNKPFVHFLAMFARRAGVVHLDRTVDQVVVRPGAGDEPEVDHLTTEGGDKLSFDLYVDATGFRSRLMTALGSEFQDFSDSLYCDRAIAANVPHHGIIKPYTLAETMDNGWCWNISQVDEDHRGYVYASAFCTEEQALAEMRAKNPGMGDHWTVKFRSGRRPYFVRGNTVAVGNAYGFVEPLESTAIHMALIHIVRLLRLLDPEAAPEDRDRANANRRVGGHWDYLRWFLAVHYRFNHRLDTPFWRQCRETVNVSGFQDVLDDFAEHGSLNARSVPRTEDSIFGNAGIDCLLLGQNVPTRAKPTKLPRAEFERINAVRRAFVASALPVSEALEQCGENPALYDSLIDGEGSWVVADSTELPQRSRLSP